MIYRVLYQIGYCTACFEFNNLEDAGKFAEDIIMHSVDEEDSHKESRVKIEIIKKAEVDE